MFRIVGSQTFGLESGHEMTKTFFVACGFKIENSTITFGSPSTGLLGLTTALRRGDGAPTVAALEGPTGHASDGNGFHVYSVPTGELRWCMRGVDWFQCVIIREPLKTELIRELRGL